MSQPRLTRRSLFRAGLGIAGAGALAGCGILGEGGGPPPPHPLDGFVASTTALADRYDATIKAVPSLAATLTPIRDAHRAHARAVAEAIGSPTPGPAASAARAPSERAQAITALAETERDARDVAVAACLETSPRLAPLLGSIAAARGTHLEVLR